ncbi:hypothetical protein Ae201684_012409 [Aphanomyces euteiches]|uniref:Uncharacterized protein n=1 Tax=Aphanomyces euteiches TaxID=100861 RepID=A0A6G0WRQ7_9STRA|nr:hypothetical protein Ae201684_012409 [Aphanomyces euteiches]
MATNSRTSCLHSNMPTEKIIGIFEHLKHRRAALEAKRAEIMADYVDEAKETTQKKHSEILWRILQALYQQHCAATNGHVDSHGRLIRITRYLSMKYNYVNTIRRVRNLSKLSTQQLVKPTSQESKRLDELRRPNSSHAIAIQLAS